MREKLSKLKDWLVFALSFEINIILTLVLFNVDIWSSIWQVARLNIAVLFFYGWLWFIDLYLNNYSAGAVEEKRRLARESALNPQPVMKARAVVEYQPEPTPVYQPQPVVQPQPIVQPKPQPVVQPEPKPEPVVEVKPEPVVEIKVEPVVEAQPEPVVAAQPQENVIEVKSNRDQLLAWIQEEENQGGN
jgi:outer membrane biosynthesis protein TonB